VEGEPIQRHSSRRSCGSVTEGFDTPDLKEAQALLEELE